MRVILASSSPRRSMILEQAGIAFEVCASGCEEVITSNVPSEVVEELSYQKAADVAVEYPEDALVIGADTVVAYDGKILGKPKDREDAIAMISMLQGNVHQVFTGVTLVYEGEFYSFHAVTDVTVEKMTLEEILRYIDTGEPFDKAGAYAIQGHFGRYISGINGEYNNVVGFPIARIVKEAKRFGISL